ncbi:MAG TPA: hypothetical protein VE914_19840 [Candidatus Angelobacter sp.]|nr:hypothetical protein [Candidatus Angelobacter sp.]
MLHPSIEITNPFAGIVERPAALAHQAADGLSESAVEASSQSREEERSSPVCAAGWAY